MKRIVITSLAIAAAISLTVTVLAFAAEKDSYGDKETMIEGDCYYEDDSGHFYWISNDGSGEIKIKAEGKGAYMGIQMDELTEEIIKKHKYPKEYGVLITKVVEDSPAEEAGIEKNDIIYMIGDKEVDCPSKLSKLVKKNEPGNKIKVVLFRDGKEKKVEVELGEQPWEYYSIDTDEITDYATELGRWADKFGSSFGYMFSADAKGKLGVTITEMNEDLASYFDVKKDAGVLVLNVHEDTPAEKAGIKSGDVIVEIDGEAVSCTDDLIDELSETEKGDEVEIIVVRKGEKKTVTAEIEDDPRTRFVISPPKTKIMHEVPMRKKFIAPEIEVYKEKGELEDELKNLKEELKKLETRLRELEKQKK